jgi:OmpA-OmpF porin, OOP family
MLKNILILLIVLFALSLNTLSQDAKPKLTPAPKPPATQPTKPKTNPNKLILQDTDTDGDGIPDHKDLCPTIAGPASNQGCPEIKDEVKKRLAWAAANILFESGKAILKASSYKVLDEVVFIFQDYPDYNVSVEGHTDSQGDDAMNQKLSEDRAKAAADYLVSKGVIPSRVSSKGFGETIPIADNATEAGRKVNRRVEFNLTPK